MSFDKRVAAFALVLLFLAVFYVVTKPKPVRTPTIVSDPLPAGTYMYLHIDGPLMMAWDTRTGAYKLCLVRPSEQGMTVDCGK